jgi:hypothetical protein
MVRAGCEEAAHVAVGVLEIAEVHAVRRADGDTGRIKSFLHTVNAKCAFVGVPLGVHETGVVRARGDARFAAADLS